ncbi:thioester domain-containing protein [Haloglycomyces albus]|uniref:thioester domain-containing protein n=1 Tax=Haloglycomyces albus TaxID=526067 RepID=UPI00046CD3F7|nr:thioester domain-containing protein [Haloglycomyces albus]
MFKRSLKAGAAAGAGLLVAIGSANAVQAQDDGNEPVRGGIDTAEGLSLKGNQGGNIQASLISVELDGQSLLSYCIQIENPLQEDKIHEETAWDELGEEVENLEEVLAVLNEGFGSNDADTVFEKAGVEGDWDAALSDQIAYAGTQSAIWSLTDGWELGDDATGSPEDVDAAVTAVQDYLLDSDLDPVPEPIDEPTFEVTGDDAEYDDGVAGPFQASTNIGPLTFESPEGTTVVDADGNELTELNDGDTFYAELSEDADEFALNITSYTNYFAVGRTFEATPDEVSTKSDVLKAQRIILAEQGSQQIEGEVTLSIEVPKQPKLPETGTTYVMFAGIGAALLAAGAVALVLMRRKRTAGDWGSPA